MILYLPRHISPRYRGEAWLSKGVGDRLKTSVFNRPRKRDSSRAMHLISDRTGHMVQEDEPQLIVQAVRFVVESIREAAR